MTCELLLNKKMNKVERVKEQCSGHGRENVVLCFFRRTKLKVNVARLLGTRQSDNTKD